MEFHLKRRVVLFLLCGALAAFFAPTAWPQEPEETEPVTDVDAAPAAIVDLSSPRATLRTFLEAMNAVQAGTADRLADALSCIYLEDVPEEERAAVGQELAEQLVEVLNAVTIDFDSLPEESDERDISVVIGEVGEEGEETELSLDFRLNDDGQWRFSRSRFEEQAEAIQVVVEEAAAEAKEQAVAGVNPLLATPRATMRTFIQAWKRWEQSGQDEALLTLDLSNIPENVRRDRGVELAYRLKDILDRDRLIVVQEIPDTASGAPYVHLFDPSDSTKRRKIEIVTIQLEDTEVFEWKFSQRTLEDLAPMWDGHFQFAQLVSGVVEQPEGARPLALRMRDYMGQNYPFMLNAPLLLENWQWLGLGLTIFLGMVVSRIAAFLLLLFVRRVFRQEHGKLDEKLERDFVRPIRIAIMAWVWWLALRPLGLDADLMSWFKVIVTTISAASAVWAVYRLVDILGNYIAGKASLTENRYDDMIIPLVVRSLKVLVVAVGVIFVIQMAGKDTTKLLAGLGIGGLAFALAAQDTLGNLFGSLTLLVDRPFQIGDWIQIGGIDGSVESVGMRSTRVRTFYNSLVIIPNKELTNSTIDNYGARRFRRFSTKLSVTYDTPPEKIEAFCEGIRQLILRHPYTRKDYFHVYLNSFGDSALEIMLYVFHDCPEWSTELRERERLMLDILRLAKKLGVEFAFPSTTLYVAKDAPPREDDKSFELSASKDALALGRREADALTREFLGTGGAIPPPVQVEMPEALGLPPEDSDAAGD